jgi:hypothetical protein
MTEAQVWFILVASSLGFVMVIGAIRYAITSWSRIQEIDIETNHEQNMEALKCDSFFMEHDGHDGFDSEYDEHALKH